MSQKSDNQNPSSERVAVLLHLANTTNLNNFAQGLKALEADYDLYINLVKGLNSPDAIKQQKHQIRAVFSSSTIIVSENRGMDVGGMFALFSLIREQVNQNKYSAILYMHSKSHDQWRHIMIKHLASPQALLAITGRNPRKTNFGMVGAYLYPFDYFNLDHCLDLIEELGLELSLDWKAFSEYNSVRHLNPVDKARWAAERKFSEGRPEIDLAYAKEKLDMGAETQSMTLELAEVFIKDGVIGPLPFFPGNFFWISTKAFNLLATKMDFDNEIAKLPLNLKSDKDHQSRAHAWERVLPIFIFKSGFSLLEMLPRR